MDSYIIVNKRLQELAVGDIIFEDIGKLTRGVHVVSPELKQSLERYKAFSIYTLQSLNEQLGNSHEHIKEFLLKREETLDVGFKAIRKEIFTLVQDNYKPFKEEDKIFSQAKRATNLKTRALFDPCPSEHFQADIQVGSQLILPAHNLKVLNNKLISAYRFFNGFKQKIPHSKNEKRTFSRQNYFSSRLPTIYHPAYDKIEVLGDEVVWHAVDTALYFMATLVNLNKIRYASGKPLSSLRFLLEGDVKENEECCYPSQFIVDATLGALLAPIGYMHRSILALLYRSDKNFSSKDLQLLKKAPLVAYNLVRNRDDVPAIAKLIMRKQIHSQINSVDKKAKDYEALHEFVQLYQAIKSYDLLVHPFILPAPVSRQETINWLIQESSPYDEAGKDKRLSKRFSRTMLNEFLNIIAPYKEGELVYLVHQDNKKEALYKGFVLNYNNDSTIPLVSILYDYQNAKNYPAGEIVFDLANTKIFILKEEKIVKQVVNKTLRELQIHDLNLRPTDLARIEKFL